MRNINEKRSRASVCSSPSFPELKAWTITSGKTFWHDEHQRPPRAYLDLRREPAREGDFLIRNRPYSFSSSSGRSSF